MIMIVYYYKELLCGKKLLIVKFKCGWMYVGILFCRKSLIDYKYIREK